MQARIRNEKQEMELGKLYNDVVKRKKNRQDPSKEMEKLLDKLSADNNMLQAFVELLDKSLQK